ncbi:hypothetical protein [Sphingobacterium lumbrici]|nr:hypothetical protein [Sphingobacterium lumbrici]
MEKIIKPTSGYSALGLGVLAVMVAVYSVVQSFESTQLFWEICRNGEG